MNDRLVTLLGALGALALFVALVLPPSQEPDVSRPVSTAIGENGYAGMQRWLDASGIRNVSLRRRYDEMDSLDLEPQGNVLVTTMPHEQQTRPDEVDWLLRWVAEGNTVLVMAALNDTPDWSLLIATREFLDNVESLTGLSLLSAVDEDGEEIMLGGVFSTEDVAYDVNPVHPLMRGVSRLVAETDATASVWQPGVASRFYVALADEQSSGRDALWEIPVGGGTIVLSTSGSMFTNRALGRADNARFLSNLLSYHLKPGAAVIFDDMHQGLTELYDPEAFFSDARLGQTLFFLLVFWLLYVVGTSGRLAPPRSRPLVPRQSDLVHAIGGFMSRKLAPATAGRMMIETWLAELHGAGRISSTGAVAWQELNAMPLVDQSRLEALQTAYEGLRRGEKIDVMGVHNHLRELRRTLA